MKKLARKNGDLLQFYFAYGSNLFREQMEQRCPKARRVGRAKLRGYSLEFKENGRGRGVANVTKRRGGIVEGGLYMVTADCIKALDRYEGHPRVYERTTVKVWIDGEKIEALTYIMHPDYKPGLPEPEYLGRISKGYDRFDLDHKRLDRAVKETRNRCYRQIEWRII